MKLKQRILYLFFLFPFITIAQIPWFHQTSIYQIYPRSFYDSNTDGIGDLQGIIQKLDHIKNLGFETIWCSPFFASPQKDFGYDISDYYSIATEYGTMQDVEQLIDEVHKRNMKIVFDLVMNHTSDKHPWFEEDLYRHPDSPTIYLWSKKPNNWKSMVTGNAWHYNAVRKQYYYAAFLPFQPDLNYRNPEVKKRMLDVARYWLNKGVDGFRLDIFNSIYEDSLLRNNPTVFSKKYTANQPECLKLAEDLRALCDSFGERMLIGEIIGNRNISKLYCGEKTNNRLTLTFNFEMLRFKHAASYFKKLINHQELTFPTPFTPVYVFSNHDRRRMMKRVENNIEKAKTVHILQLTTRGVACLYNGEEAAMTDGKIPYKKALDPIPSHVKLPRFLVEMADETLNRDEVRTPICWNSNKNAGFSNADSTWLPINQNFKERNMETSQLDSFSIYHIIKRLLELKKTHASLHSGELILSANRKTPNSILTFQRIANSDSTFICINFSSSRKKVKWEKNNTLLLSSNSKILYIKDKIVLPPNSAVIWK